MIVTFDKSETGIDIYRVTHRYGTTLVRHYLADDTLKASATFGANKETHKLWEQAVRDYLDMARIRHPDSVAMLRTLGLL